MKIKNKAYLPVGVVLTLAGEVALASSAYIGVHSIDGLGRAFSGETAIVESASAISKNPALIMELPEGSHLAAGTGIVISDWNAKVKSHPFIQESEDQSDLNADNFGPNYLPLPGLHYAKNLGDWGYGVSISSYHGGLLDYEDTGFGIRELGDDTYALTANFQFDLAYRVNPKLNIGAGLDFGYGIAHVERKFGFVGDDRFLNFVAPVINLVGQLQQDGNQFAVDNFPNFKSFLNPEDQLATFRGDAYTFGWHVGLSYEPTERLRLGLSYRSSMDYEFEGDYYSDLPELPQVYSYGTGSDVRKTTVQLGQPAMADAGVFYQLNDKWDIHFGLFWQQWSELQELNLKDAKTGETYVQKDMKHQDNFKYSIGATHHYNDKMKFRFGFALDKSAVKKEDATLLFPSSDRYWYTAGLNYKLNETSDLDFAIAYAKNKSIEIRERGLIAEALDELPDVETVGWVLDAFDINLDLGTFENINFPIRQILQPGIYEDSTSVTDFDATLLFLGIQYNKTF